MYADLGEEKGKEWKWVSKGRGGDTSDKTVEASPLVGTFARWFFSGGVTLGAAQNVCYEARKVGRVSGLRNAFACAGISDGGRSNATIRAHHTTKEGDQAKVLFFRVVVPWRTTDVQGGGGGAFTFGAKVKPKPFLSGRRVRRVSYRRIRSKGNHRKRTSGEPPGLAGLAE